MNDSVLRPLNSNPPLTDLQRADELVKREMIIMLHHDCVETPTPQQLGEGKKGKAGEKVFGQKKLQRILGRKLILKYFLRLYLTRRLIATTLSVIRTKISPRMTFLPPRSFSRQR